MLTKSSPISTQSNLFHLELFSQLDVKDPLIPNPKIEPPNQKNTNQNPKKPPHSSLASIKIQTIPPI